MYRKQLSVVGLCAAMLAGFSGGVAQAQTVPADKAVKYRQAAFTQMGMHMTRLNAALKGDAPSDKASLELSADVVELMGRVAFEGFVPGGDQTGSKAQPEMWKELPKFKQLTQAMQADAIKLKAAAKTGDLAQVKPAFAAVAKACKACHDPYLGK